LAPVGFQGCKSKQTLYENSFVISIKPLCHFNDIYALQSAPSAF